MEHEKSTENRSTHNKGLLAAILAPFFIALSIVTTNTAGKHAPALTIAALGPLFSVPFLLLLNLPSRAPLQFRSLLTEWRASFWQILLSRSIIGQILIVFGYTATTPIKAVLLLRLEPVFVFLWSILLQGEKPRLVKIVLLLVLVAGSMLVVAPSGATGGPNLGDACIVLSLLFFSFSYIPSQKIMPHANATSLNLLANFFGGVLIALVGLLVERQHFFAVDTEGLWLITGYAVIFFTVAINLYFYAFTTVKAWVIASLLSLEVVFVLIMSSIWLHEKAEPLQLLGAAIVLATTVVINLQERGVSKRSDRA